MTEEKILVQLVLIDQHLARIWAQGQGTLDLARLLVQRDMEQIAEDSATESGLFVELHPELG